ncbi:unnamed protein product, partial [Prorocentrum cordatum]
AHRAWLLAAVLCGAQRPLPGAQGSRPPSAAPSRAGEAGPPGTPERPGTAASSGARSSRSDASDASGARWREAQEVAEEAARGVPRSYDPAGAEAAMQVLKVLGTKMKSHLVLMEYLARVSRACDALQQADVVRLAEECVASRLRAFRQRLALFLRTEQDSGDRSTASSLE